MSKQYFILAVTGLSLLQYFLLLGLRAEAHVSTYQPTLAVTSEAKKTFSQLVDLIADSQTGLSRSFSWQDSDELPVGEPLDDLVPKNSPDPSISPVNDEIQDIINYYSDRYQVDPLLISLIIKQESGFDPQALSPAGAMGLMQLMPDTAWLLAVDDPFDPEQNIEGGIRYFTQQLDRFNSVELALAAYNSGPKAVENWGGIPPYPETENYVRTIMADYIKQSTPDIPAEIENSANSASAPALEDDSLPAEEEADRFSRSLKGSL